MVTKTEKPVLSDSLYREIKQKFDRWLQTSINTELVRNQRGKTWVYNKVIIQDFNHIIETIRKDKPSLRYLKYLVETKGKSKKQAIGIVLGKQNIPRIFAQHRKTIYLKINLLLRFSSNTAQSIMEERKAMMENYFWVIANLFGDVPNEFELQNFEYFVGDQRNTLFHKAQSAFESGSKDKLQHKFRTFFNRLEKFLKITDEQERAQEDESKLEDVSEDDLNGLDFKLFEEYREPPLNQEMWEVIWESFTEDF